MDKKVFWHSYSLVTKVNVVNALRGFGSSPVPGPPGQRGGLTTSYRVAGHPKVFYKYFLLFYYISFIYFLNINDFF
jgi:hypothetical protein